MKLNNEILEYARQHNINLKNYLSIPNKNINLLANNSKINDSDVIEIFENYSEFYENPHIYFENLMDIEKKILNMNITLEIFFIYKQIVSKIDKEEYEKIPKLMEKLK